MIIKSLFMQNFMSYKDAKINFLDYSGITVIEGKSDASSRDSNGSGKSAILDAITYALFGKMLRKQKNAESVVNRFNCDKRMLLILTIEVNGMDLTIERSRHKGIPLLRVSGFDDKIATTKGTQEMLEKFIGMDYRLFTSSVMFGGVASSFCSMTDAERKKILEEMLEFDYFLLAQKAASQHADMTEQEIGQLDAKLTASNDMAIEFEQIARQADEKAASFEKEKKARMNALREKHSTITEEYTAVQDELMQAKKDYVKVSEEFEIELRTWRKLYTEADTTVQDLAEKKHKADIAVAEVNVSLREAKKQLDQVKPDKHPDLCPTCGQRWPQKQDHSMLKQAIDNKQKRIEEVQTELSAKQRQLKSIEAEYDVALKACSKIKAAEPDPIGTLDQYVEPLTEKFAELKHLHECSIKDIKHEESSKNPHEGQSEEMTKKAKASKKASAELSEELKEKKVLLAAYQYWNKAFGKSGIPSYLIDSAVPILNESASEISSILTDGELNVTFDPASAKGSGSIFDVRAEFADGSDSYDMSSRGEHSRIDLAVLLSIRELLAKRGSISCNQVWVDEVFDGMDQNGIAQTMMLLRKRYPETSFFIVSHEPELKSYANSVITVEKSNGISQIGA